MISPSLFLLCLVMSPLGTVCFWLHSNICIQLLFYYLVQSCSYSSAGRLVQCKLLCYYQAKSFLEGFVLGTNVNCYDRTGTWCFKFHVICVEFK